VTFVRRHQPGAAGAVAACGPGYALAAVTAGVTTPRVEGRV
jgi:hypothetical protein